MAHLILTVLILCCAARLDAQPLTAEEIGRESRTSLWVEYGVMEQIRNDLLLVGVGLRHQWIGIEAWMSEYHVRADSLSVVTNRMTWTLPDLGLDLLGVIDVSERFHLILHAGIVFEGMNIYNEARPRSPTAPPEDRVEIRERRATFGLAVLWRPPQQWGAFSERLLVGASYHSARTLSLTLGLAL